MDQEPNKTIEEQADDILSDDAKSHHKSLRKMGMIDARRARTIREKEITMSYLESKRRGHD
jgi:hypothetical protein